MAKVYTDEAKYSGEDDSFDHKLMIFHDLCARSDIPPEVRIKVFPVMLKGLALDHYYSNISANGTPNNLAMVCEAMRAYFEGAEHKRSLLNRWDETTLKAAMSNPKNEGKSMKECLMLMIKELRHLQHGLDPELRTDRFIHNKIINACQDVSACQCACKKPSDSLAGLINDLKSSINTFQKSNASETFFTDRRYHKHSSSFRPNKFRFSTPNKYNSQPSYNRYKKKSCLICHKEGCWSSNHSKEERDKLNQRLKNRVSNGFDRHMDRRVAQYIAEYEGIDSGSENEDEELDKEFEALILDAPPEIPLSPLEEKDETRNFITSFGSMAYAESMTMNLANRSFAHSISLDSKVSDVTTDPATTDFTTTDPDPFSYIATERYTSREFYGIMVDTGASRHSTAGYGQYLAYKKDYDDSATINDTKAGVIHVQFGIGSTSSMGSIVIGTPIGKVEFHIVQADTPFLLCLSDMDRLKTYLNNVDNILVTKHDTIPIVRRFGHPFLLWDKTLHAFISNSFSSYPCFLTETELRRLHRRFGHPSAERLHTLLIRSGHEDFNKAALDKLTKYCSYCQKHGKSPGRFKFTLKEDIDFNYSIIVDIMFIDNAPILHIVDESTRFQAARWLTSMTAKHTWNALRMCWIDVYLGPPDFICHDAGKNFVSKEFRQLASSMAITTKAAPVEAHWSIGIVERYHAVLRRAYRIIMKELKKIGINKEEGLQMAIKAINDTAGPDGLVPTLLVFGVYPRMHDLDPPSPSIVQRSEAIRKAMEEIRKIRAERQTADALNTRNGPIVDPVHDLPLNADVLVWREGNGGRTGKWTGPHKLLGIENQTCIINLPSGPTKFRSTVIKPYLIENLDDDEKPPQPQAIPDPIPAPPNPSEAIRDPSPSPSAASSSEALQRRQPKRTRRLPTRYQNMADISIFLQQEKAPAPIPTFIESRRKEINGLLDKGVFEVVSLCDVPKDIRIFNSRFVDEIKNIGTSQAFEKSRLVVQAYNDQGKELVLTQSPTIQRASQRLILALAACTELDIYLRDISQAYVQSTTSLNREFYIRPPKELGLQEGSVLKVIKPLYGVPEAGAHWFNTYHNHHTKNLSMKISTYDPCLLYANDEGLGMVGLQTDDSLILADEAFAAEEEKQLRKEKLMAKDRERLTVKQPIKFSGGYIKRNTDGSIYLSQEKQCKNLRLVTLKEPTDLVSARGQVRKAVTPKDQHVAQRARGAYIATVSQPEAAFDLSFAAQSVNPKEDDAKLLNKRLKWQIDHAERGLHFVKLDISTLKLIIFTDSSFANNLNLSSQIGYVVVLADATNKANILHWSSIKCKRVTRSVLASELYAMAYGFDAGSVMKSTVERIMKIPILPLILCTDSKSLYDCLVKLGTTQEKRLMVDLMCLRQSYERREIMEVRWIGGGTNPADAMTKSKPCKALESLIDTNTVNLQATAWVERENPVKSY